MQFNFKVGDKVRVKAEIDERKLEFYGTTTYYKTAKTLTVHSVPRSMEQLPGVVSIILLCDNGDTGNYICPDFIEKVEPNEGF